MDLLKSQQCREISVMPKSKRLRYLVLAPSHPLPVSNGSHLDTLGIVETLENFGAEVLVLSFSKTPRIDYHHLTKIASAPRSRNPFKFLFALTPWQATSRRLTSSQVLMAIDFAPDNILCIQEYAFLSLKQVERKLPVPPKVILRRANDEIVFIRAARSGASMLRRLYLMSEELKFHVLERKWSNRKELELWDIGSGFRNDSMQIRRVIGPIFPDLPYDLSEKENINKKSVIYVGNLSLGHCVDGLRWFIANCWPSIAEREPESKLVIAGLNPTLSLLELANENAIEIIANPLETDSLLISSSIFINPIFQGSGVNMKLCRPAQFEIPIVSTHFGARGYLDKMKSIRIANTPNEFADNVVELLRDFDLQKAIGLQHKSEIEIYLGSNEQNAMFTILSERHNED